MGRINRDKVGQNTGGSFTAPAKADISPEQLPPAFCLRYARNGFRVSDCNIDTQAAFAKTLDKLSQITWAQIKTSPRHGCGSEKIARNSIRDGIPSIVTEDVELIALRFAGKAPMVGFREGRIFHVIWLDHNFTVYDHGS